MIYCKCCEEFFEESEVKKIPQYVPYGSTETVESTIHQCPHCNSEHLLYDVVMVECEHCGKMIPDEDTYRSKDDMCICQQCYIAEQHYD